MELALDLDRSRRRPLSIQIAHGVRDAITTQRLSPGMKLPPTREMARRLQVSRMVVVEAYEWLASEGYVESRPGSGTFVSQTLVWPHQPSRRIPNPPRRTDILPEKQITVDFRTGVPALDQFPRNAWRVVLTRGLRNARNDHLGYGPVEGLPQLRRVVAEYVARTRGLPIAPEQLVITVGAAQALDLALRSLAPLQSIVTEDPCPEPFLRLARLHNLRTDAIPVDKAGLRVDLLNSVPPGARVINVVPSHQFPTGEVMNLERRLELLKWVEQNDAVILEDDYDSEFRYDQSPPIALAALNTTGRVIYIGSFSKTMFPGLRLGFAVVPERYIGRMLELKWFSDRCVPVLEQLALAEWIENGMFERHVRKMRFIYSRRRETLVRALEENFNERITIHGVPAGMHIMVEFNLPVSESELIDLARQVGVKLYPASLCFVSRQPEKTTIIMGFGNLTDAKIIRGVRALAGVAKPYF